MSTIFTMPFSKIFITVALRHANHCKSLTNSTYSVCFHVFQFYVMAMLQKMNLQIVIVHLVVRFRDTSLPHFRFVHICYWDRRPANPPSSAVQSFQEAIFLVLIKKMLRVSCTLSQFFVGRDSIRGLLGPLQKERMVLITSLCSGSIRAKP